MHVDFKVTTWERVELPDSLTEEQSESILDRIKSGIISTSNDLVEEVENLGKDTDYSIIPETEEQLSVEENGGSSTLEVFINKGSDPLYKNGE